MSIQPVLGPYQFATEDHPDVCGCGGNYCTPFINGDKITFQVNGQYSCCEFEAGCEELNGDCVTAQSFTSDLTFVQATANISFTAQAFVANDWILKANFTFAANTKYLISFKIRNHTSFETINARIGTTDSLIGVLGNGDFAVVVEPGYVVPTAANWGIIAFGGDTEVTLVLESLTLCVWREFTAGLYDSDGVEVISIPMNYGSTGNQMFEQTLLIPSEVPEGCYTIRLTEDCGPTTYISQCLTMMASIPCGGKPEFQNMLFKWRNRNDAFGYDYTSDPAYYNQVRLYGRLKHPTFPDDTEIPTFSNNTNTVINARVKKLWKVALNDLPEFMHNTISTMRRHSEMYIDGVQFVVGDGSYSPNWRKSSELATSEFEAFDQGFDGVSTNC